MKTTDTWTPEGKRLKEEIARLLELEVRVGFQKGKVFYKSKDDEEQKAPESEDPEGEESGAVDLALVAIYNEIGTSHAPARPFLRQTADKNEAKITALMHRQKRLLIQGNATAQSVLEEIGNKVKGMVQETITDGEFAPNAPSTAARKRKNGKDPVKPLEDTGHMRENVNFVIVKKGTPD